MTTGIGVFGGEINGYFEDGFVADATGNAFLVLEGYQATIDAGPTPVQVSDDGAVDFSIGAARGDHWVLVGKDGTTLYELTRAGVLSVVGPSALPAARDAMWSDGVDHVFRAGAGAIVHTRLAGASIAAEASDALPLALAACRVLRMSGRSATDAFALVDCSDGSTVVHFDGSAWTSWYASSKHYSGLAAVPGDTRIYLGNDEEVLRLQAGSVERIDPIPGSSLVSVAANDVFALGYDGAYLARMSRWDGAAWSPRRVEDTTLGDHLLATRRLLVTASNDNARRLLRLQPNR